MLTITPTGEQLQLIEKARETASQAQLELACHHLDLRTERARHFHSVRQNKKISLVSFNDDLSQTLISLSNELPLGRKTVERPRTLHLTTPIQELLK